MLRSSKLLNRGKMTADLALLGLIIILIPGYLNVTETVYSRLHLVIVATSLICWLFSARILGLYGDFRMKPFSIEWVVFLKSFVLYILLTSFIFSQLLHQQFFSRKQLLIQLILLFVLMPIQKLFIRLALKRINNSDNIARKVLIVGAGETGMDFYRQYVKNKHFGYKLAGFIDDEKDSSLNGHYLGKTTDLDKVIAKYELDDIVVTLPTINETQIENIISVGEKQGKRIRIIPNYGNFGDGKVQVDSLGSLSMITLRSLPLDIVDNKIYKRIFDVVFSLFVIIFLLSWVIPIVSVLIKLGSKGPVFFKQGRWGLNNKLIVCYKFRSMVVTSKDVDEKGIYQQAMKNDPRITRFGKFLRKTNLDELPQFLNVLLGSMSVVGPRPHPVPLNIASKDSVEKYMMRHWVKPGITGWAQVNGYRGETRRPQLMKKRIEHDVWYIENWSLWLDLQIIVQTVTNMIKGDKKAF
jgi:putative colanic acid biosysnthesis UDP-glucose lipid carrier transferase